MKQIILVLLMVVAICYSGFSDDKKNKDSQQATVQFNWRGASLFAITTEVQAVTGKQILFSSALPLKMAKIYFMSDEKFTPDELFDLYQSILQVCNYAIIPTTNKDGKEIYKIVQHNVAFRLHPRVLEKVERPSDEYICRVFRLKYADPDSLRQLVSQFASPGAGVASVKESNALIVNDYTYNIQKIEKIIKLVDVETPDVLIESIRLKNAVASQIVPILQSLVQTLTRVRRPMPRYPGMPRTPYAGQEPISITADTRTNSVIVLALPSRMPQIKELIAKLDEKVKAEAAGIFVYHVKHHPSVKTLAELISKTFTEFITQQTRAPTTGRAVTAAPVQVTWTKPSIAADEKTNSIVIVADRNTYQIILTALEALDRREPLVFIKATIIEVSTTDSFDFGVELHRYIEPDGRTPLVGSSRHNLSVIEQTDEGPQITPLDTPGLTLALIRKEAGRIPFILKTFKEKGLINILSEPEILANNNQQAEIKVTEAFPVGQQLISAGVGQTAFTRYEEAGITLSISPHISEAQYLRLDIKISVEGFTREPADPTMPPPKTSRSITSSIQVPSGRTVVIGGLTNENQRDTVGETPFFSSIPILGELFKRKTQGTTKRTLYIFITPYIVADERFTTLSEISLQKKGLVEKQTKRSLDYLPFFGYRDRLAPTTFRFHKPLRVEKTK